MKRSEINAAIREMEEFVKEHRFALPPFASFTPADWETKGHECDEIRDTMLGWDITDFGSNDFCKTGFSVITIRNGSQTMEGYKKPYAEKLLYMREGQILPMHFHWSKMEDIINRGGGNVLIQVYNATENDELSGDPVTVIRDGVRETVPAGTRVRLCPGESITIYQRLYHSFTVEEGCGPVLLGEVSMCNDDNVDNRFYEPIGRFPEIEEDEAPYRLLCNEYPAVKQSTV